MAAPADSNGAAAPADGNGAAGAAAAAVGVHSFWRRSVVQTLYETMVFRVLPQDCLTVSWLPGSVRIDGSCPCMVRQRLLLGTRSSGGAKEGGAEGGGDYSDNWLVIVEATLPSATAEPAQQGAYPTVPPEIAEVERIPHGPHDVNRAAAMPQSADIIATTSDCGDAFLFSLAAQWRRPRRRPRGSGGGSGTSSGGGEGGDESSSGPAAKNDDGDEDQRLRQRRRQQQRMELDQGVDGQARRPGDGDEDTGGDKQKEGALFLPDCILEGRASGGFGLCWDALQEGRLLAAGRDGGGGGVVCTWDAWRAAGRLRPSEVRPCCHGGGSGSGANDVCCDPRSSGPFVTVGDDGAARLSDARSAPSGSGSGGALFQAVRGESLDCVHWDPSGGFWVAAGGGGGGVYVGDVRSPGRAVMQRRQHAGGVTQVQWSAGAPGVLAASGQDGFVSVWDVSLATGAEAPLPTTGAAAADGAAGAGAAVVSPAALVGRRARKAVTPRRLGGGGGGGEQQRLRQHLRALGGGAEGAPRGLLFLHAGHSSVEGVAWNPDRPWMVASVGAAPLEAQSDEADRSSGAAAAGPGCPQRAEQVEEGSMLQLWEPLSLRQQAGGVHQ